LFLFGLRVELRIGCCGRGLTASDRGLRLKEGPLSRTDNGNSGWLAKGSLNLGLVAQAGIETRRWRFVPIGGFCGRGPWEQKQGSGA